MYDHRSSIINTNMNISYSISQFLISLSSRPLYVTLTVTRRLSYKFPLTLPEGLFQSELGSDVHYFPESVLSCTSCEVRLPLLPHLQTQTIQGPSRSFLRLHRPYSFADSLDYRPSRVPRGRWWHSENEHVIAQWRQKLTSLFKFKKFPRIGTDNTALVWPRPFPPSSLWSTRPPLPSTNLEVFSSSSPELSPVSDYIRLPSLGVKGWSILCPAPSFTQQFLLSIWYFYFSHPVLVTEWGH